MIKRDKMGRFVKGAESPRKGIKLSEEIKQKIRETNIRKGIRPPKSYGRIPWNKGKHYKMINKGSFKKGEHRSPNTEFKYKNGLGYRHLLENGKLFKSCKICKEPNIKRLHVHHKDKNRLNNKLENLLILCRKCHLKLHNRIERKYVLGRKSSNLD